MGSPLSDAEMQRRIAEMLKTPKAGRAVAGQLNDRTEAWAHRAAVAELRARRLETVLGGTEDTQEVATADHAPGDGRSRVH